MPSSGVTRVIREDRLTGNSLIQITGVDDLFRWLTVTDGEIKDTLRSEESVVYVLSPEVALFRLDEPERDFAIDQFSAYGLEYRFRLETDSITDGLELLVKALKLKSNELIETKNRNLRQFYPYMTYDVSASSLTGRLLVSKVIAPTIDREIKIATSHFNASPAYLKPNCLYCEVIGRTLKTQEGPLVFSPDFPNITYPSNAPVDPHFMYVAPKQHHSRFTDLEDGQLTALASSIYDLVEMIKKDASKTREFDTIHIVFHSAPLHYRRTLEQIYHTHFEAILGKTLGKGDHMIIPGTEWRVTPFGPEEMVQRLNP